MTIKLKLFFMFIMLPPLLYGQNKLVEESIIYSSDISSYKKKIEKTIFFDTETNLPVFELILDTARSSKMYTSYYILGSGCEKSQRKFLILVETNH